MLACGVTHISETSFKPCRLEAYFYLRCGLSLSPGSGYNTRRAYTLRKFFILTTNSSTIDCRIHMIMASSDPGNPSVPKDEYDSIDSE